MPQVQGRLVTYCTNIHPGESWREVFAALREHVPAVKAAVSPELRMPLGLRLSARAARELDSGERDRFAHWLGEHGLFVSTLNGFPYGAFHAPVVKEQVYEPDWRSPARLEYTKQLAGLLARWLPDGLTGSISTVPLGWKAFFGPEAATAARENLQVALRHLSAIRERDGKTIVLALEPEPGCVLETTEEVCRFFTALDLADAQRRHLGVCYDCCHQAVQFESPRPSFAHLAEAGVPIAKVQVSSALRATDAGPEALARFAEPRYLHQVVVRRRDGTLARYPDLPLALARHARGAGDEWRCHFHVPIFHAGNAELRSTQDFLDEALPLVPPGVLLELETYTWDVLPDELRSAGVTDSIIRELGWLAGRI